MDQDLITQTIQELYLNQEKSLVDVQNYLSLKYKIDLDPLVLKLRLQKLMVDEKAVA